MSGIPLGPFVLELPLGRGGMGVVWQGNHRITGTPVAVKVLRKDCVRDADRLGRFGREVRSVARLDHPGIVRILDHGVVDRLAADRSNGQLTLGSPYLVMELATGGALDRLPAIPDWHTLRSLLLAILDALAHAHARGVVHRDIKPANVLIASASDLRPGIKLTDFGLAHALGSKGEGGRVSGTLSYMPPEQIRGLWRDFGPWTDLYAFGGLVWRLTTGRLPYWPKKGKELARAHLYEPLPRFDPRTPVPSGFLPWMQCLLAKDPRDRYKRAADAAAALRYLGGSKRLAAPVARGARDEDSISQSYPVPELTSHDGDGPLDGYVPTTVPRTQTEPGIASIPDTWRMPVQARMATAVDRPLIGAGLGLFGIRTVPMVDRDHERDAMWAALRLVARSGRPGAVIVRGPGGVGKSRLVDWMCRRAHEVGAAEVLVARHGPLDGPGDAMRWMLRDHLRVQGLDRPNALTRIETFLAGRDAGLYEADALTELLLPATKEDLLAGARPVRLEGPTERHVVVVNYLKHLMEERPVIVCLDDAQWGADALGFVQHVLGQADDSPRRILFLITARSELLSERPDEKARVEVLRKHPRVATLDLGPLPERFRAELISAMLPLQSELAAQVEERTAGNPLFAMQLLGDWVTSDGLRVTDRGFALRRGASFELPDDLQVIWRRRLGRALEGEPEISWWELELGAALGRRVLLSEWEAVCGEGDSGEARRERLLERLQRECLVVAEESTWSFSHEVLRETVAQLSREAGRWSRHQLVCARMIRERYGATSATAERLGRHLLEAGEYDDAIRYIFRSVGHVKSSMGYRAALGLLARAERAMVEMKLPREDRRWGELWATQASLYRLQGDYDRCIQLARKAESSARSFGWKKVLLDALDNHAVALLHRNRLEEADRLLEESLLRAEQAGDIGAQATARYFMSEASRQRRDIPMAQEQLEQAAELFKELGDETGMADCWRDRGNFEVMQGNYTAARRFFDGALAVYRRHGRRLGAAHALNGLAEVLRKNGDLDGAENFYAESLDLFESIGAGQMVIPRLNLGLVLLMRGDYAGARLQLERARYDLESQNRPAFLGAANATLLAALSSTDAWGEWNRTIEVAEELLGKTPMASEDIVWCLRKSATDAASKGRTHEALRALELAEQQLVRMGKLDEEFTASLDRARSAIRGMR